VFNQRSRCGGGKLALAARTENDALQKVASVRVDVVGFLREKRYEEALAALYRARSESPADRELQKSIDQLKEFLIGVYAKRLGGLDQIAREIPLSAVRTPDAVLIARYIDGTSTFGDLAQMCPLGQLRTLQVLVGLYVGTEPTRIHPMEIPRVAATTPDPPTSGLRSHVAPGSGLIPTVEVGEDSDVRPPDTARSGSVAPVVSSPETENDRRYKEAFGRGTAAFVQRRFSDAAEQFDACLRIRPGDRAADVMFKRSLAQGEGR
jgi:hypothetical protein